MKKIASITHSMLIIFSKIREILHVYNSHNSRLSVLFSPEHYVIVPKEPKTKETNILEYSIIANVGVALETYLLIFMEGATNASMENSKRVLMKTKGHALGEVM